MSPVIISFLLLATTKYLPSVMWIEIILSLATMITVEKSNGRSTGFPERPRSEERMNGEKKVSVQCVDRSKTTPENQPLTQKSKHRQSQCVSHGHTAERPTIEA
jgi:hypothetical protein